MITPVFTLLPIDDLSDSGSHPHSDANLHVGSAVDIPMPCHGSIAYIDNIAIDVSYIHSTNEKH